MSNTVVVPGGARAIVHIHQAKMRKGEPAIIVRRRGKSLHFSAIDVLGPSTVIHSPTPDRCGARAWIQTYSDIEGTP